MQLLISIIINNFMHNLTQKCNTDIRAFTLIHLSTNTFNSKEGRGPGIKDTTKFTRRNVIQHSTAFLIRTQGYKHTTKDLKQLTKNQILSETPISTNKININRTETNHRFYLKLGVLSTCIEQLLPSYLAT